MQVQARTGLSLNKICFICSVVSAVFSIQALAQSSSAISVFGPASSLPANRPQGTVYNSNVRVEAMSYPTAIPESPQLSRSLLTSVDFKMAKDTENSQSKMDVSGGLYEGAGGSFLAVREIYTSGIFNQGTTVGSVGRKVEHWSQLDNDWQLGFWQPKFNLDSLRPQDQGLTGFFFKQTYNEAEVLLFASPIFIPTMGPEIKEKNGSLVSESRWYRTPSNSFALRGQQTRLVYALDVPDYRELVLKPAWGTRISLGNLKHGLFASLNYGYKPINSLLLKYKTSLFLPEEDPQTGEVLIRPAVGYHEISGMDVGYGFGPGKIVLSYLQDRPNQQLPSDNWVQQQPNAMKGFGVHMDSDVRVPGFFSPVNLTAGYLRISGATIQDYDAEGNEQGAIFDTRTNFTNAAMFKALMTTMVAKKRLDTQLKYTREFDQVGSIINAELNYFPTNQFALILGADALGPDKVNSQNDRDTRFLNQYRSNDRVYGGLNYAF